MILVDTSVWIDHLHRAEARLVELLEADLVVTHEGVIAELALGSIRDRPRLLASMSHLSRKPVASSSRASGVRGTRTAVGARTERDRRAAARLCATVQGVPVDARQALARGGAPPPHRYRRSPAGRLTHTPPWPRGNRWWKSARGAGCSGGGSLEPATPGGSPEPCVSRTLRQLGEPCAHRRFWARAQG